MEIKLFINKREYNVKSCQQFWQSGLINDQVKQRYCNKSKIPWCVYIYATPPPPPKKKKAWLHKQPSITDNNTSCTCHIQNAPLSYSTSFLQWVIVSVLVMTVLYNQYKHNIAQTKIIHSIYRCFLYTSNKSRMVKVVSKVTQHPHVI